MREQFHMSLVKASTVEDEYGVLTPKGLALAHSYANSFVGGVRDTSIEQRFPEMGGLFYDIRNDQQLAREYASPEVEKSFKDQLFARMSEQIYNDPPPPTHFSGLSKALFTQPFSQEVGIDLAKLSDWTSYTIRPEKLEKAQAVIAIGKKGGKIIGYSKGKPVYQSEPKPEKVKSGAARKWINHLRGKNYSTVGEFRLRPPPRGAKPVYKKERSPLHKEIIRSFMEDSSGRPVPPVPVGTKKIAYVMMGGPASGKTSLVKQAVGVRKGTEFSDFGFVNVNPDDVKEKLPEWDEGLSRNAKDTAWVTHSESSDVATEIYKQAVSGGTNIVLDGTGKNVRRHVERIHELQKHGYEVRLMMPDIMIEEAATRAIKRAEATGRHVPIDKILKPAHRVIPVNFEPIARQADTFALYDMMVAMGEAPILKWSGAKGRPDEVLDPAWVESFKIRGKQLATFQGNLEGKKMSKALVSDTDLGGPTQERRELIDPLPMSQVLTNIAATAPTYANEHTENKYPNASKGHAIEAVVEDVDLRLDTDHIVYE